MESASELAPSSETLLPSTPGPARSTPATLFQHLRFDPRRLADEAAEALVIVNEIKTAQADVAGWINFFLCNQTGDQTDMRLVDYAGQCQSTALAARMPYTLEIIRQLQNEGFSFQYCRIAVLEGRSLLRCHVDMYTSARLIVPLTEQGNDFRHVFEEHCFGMRVGDLWGIDGNVCHGAAHLGHVGSRVALLLDARSDPGYIPEWWSDTWAIPASRMIRREPWTRTVREAKYAQSTELIVKSANPQAAEREWLLVPFEFELSPSDAYAELIEFCNNTAQQSGTEDREFWLERARHWTQRNCRCV